MDISDQGRNSPVAYGTRAAHSSAEEIFNALEMVIGDIQNFVADFCSRLQSVESTGQTVQRNANDGDDLIGEREQWEAMRSRAEQNIRQQTELLADAWLRLEAEQRTLLQRKEGLAAGNVGQTHRHSVYKINNLGTVPQIVTGGCQAPRQTERSAFQEFERLRQEIQSYRPQSNLPRD